MVDNTMLRPDTQTTISNVYPGYLKKELLKQTVAAGLVFNDKRKRINPEQFSFTFPDIIDVSEYNNIDDKINSIITSEKVLKYIEEFEYTRQYRHFCYFKIEEFPAHTLEDLIINKKINIFKRDGKIVDTYDKPSLYLSDNLLHLKFSYQLVNETNSKIKFLIICVIDKENNIVELRFDRVGIAYKNSYNFYRDNVHKVLEWMAENLGIEVSGIDFKAVVDYMKDEKDEISIYAQKMQRNGTTAYLEAYDDDNNVMPILGELEDFIKNEEVLFNTDKHTMLIKSKLETFIQEIQVKSDLPMVKIKLDEKGIKFGITHDYKNSEFSLFMFYEELLLSKEMLDYVRTYLIGCHNELTSKISS